MSLLDQLKNKFAARSASQESESVESPAPAAAGPADADHEVDRLLEQIDQRLEQSVQEAEVPPPAVAAMPDAEDPGLSQLPPDVSTFGEESTGLPLIGRRPLYEQQRLLLTMVGAGAAVLVITGALSLGAANRQAGQLTATGQALMQSQRLAKSVSQALVGSPAAFPEVRESGQVLARNLRGLAKGNEDLTAASGSTQDVLSPLLPLVDRAEKNAGVVLAQQTVLTQVGQALRLINRQSSDLLETAETVSSLKLQGNASPVEISAVGELVMLTQRIGKSANEFLTLEGVSPEAVFLLGKDLNSFREIADGLLRGNAELRLPGTKDAATRERLEQLISQYEETRAQATAILGNLQGLVAAREAQNAIVAEFLRTLEYFDGLLFATTNRPMDIDEAIEQMELLGHDFFLFHYSAEDIPSVVYRRKDGSVGLLVPKAS
mgnify:CR=1 FL=1